MRLDDILATLNTITQLSNEKRKGNYSGPEVNKSVESYGYGPGTTIMKSDLSQGPNEWEKGNWERQIPTSDIKQNRAGADPRIKDRSWEGDFARWMASRMSTDPSMWRGPLAYLPGPNKDDPLMDLQQLLGFRGQHDG